MMKCPDVAKRQSDFNSRIRYTVERPIPRAGSTFFSREWRRSFRLAERGFNEPRSPGPGAALVAASLYAEGSTMDILRLLIAILLPPLGVFLQVGLGLHFWLNILLTLLGYIPGIVHAIWVIVKK